MALAIKKIIISIVMVGLACWVVQYGAKARIVEYEKYTYTDDQREHLKYFAKAHYNYGVKAWVEDDLITAGTCFANSATRNCLNIRSWLKLAQVESEKNNMDKATRILTFTDSLTKRIIKWKWQQIILAGELGVDDIFFDNINFIIPYNKLSNDAFQLLDVYFNGDVEEAVNVLDPDNIQHYLKWLIKWKRLEDTYFVWDLVKAPGRVDEKLVKYYINFLIHQKNVQLAALIRLEFMGLKGMTNPGFESPISNTGFGWRKGNNKDNQWDLRRIVSDLPEKKHVVRVSFFGKDNIDFYHFSQIVPVEPLTQYELSFDWRSRNITTDQRPYIDIYSFGGKGRWRSETVPPNSDWHDQKMLISVPPECHAIVVRLRRQKSRRFDSKIDGVLWLDDFEFKMIRDL